MTAEEETACKKLLKSEQRNPLVHATAVAAAAAAAGGGDDNDNNIDDDNEEPQNPASPVSLKDRINHECKRLKEAAENRYVNCNYIFGSAAKAERCWSLAGNILIK